MLLVHVLYIFLIQTNDNDNKYLVEFDISWGNMTTSAKT